jgi:hypothetical protein
MRRQTLIDALEPLAPLLAPLNKWEDKRHLPDEAGLYFWFSGTHAIAFHNEEVQVPTTVKKRKYVISERLRLANGRRIKLYRPEIRYVEKLVEQKHPIAMAIPLRTPFTGGIFGRVLLRLLKSTRTRGINFAVQKGKAEILAGTTTMTFPLRDFSMLPTVLPPQGRHGEAIGEEFFDALEFCVRGLGGEWIEHGVAIIADVDGKAAMYATNKATLSVAELTKFSFPGRLHLSETFAKTLVKHRRPGWLELHVCNALNDTNKNDELVFRDTDGAILFEPLHKPPRKPIDFVDIINYHYDPKVDKMIDVPKGLRRIMNLLGAVADHTEHKSAIISVDNGQMTLSAQSESGSVEYQMDVDPSHPPVQVRVEPLLISKARLTLSKWVVTGKAVILKSGNKTLLIGTTGP